MIIRAVLIIILLLTVGAGFASGQVVSIPDSNLRAAIESALGKTAGTPISKGEMATLTELNARDASISDLTGLEFATNLTTLRLHNNHITDISPLSSLTELRGLYLDNSNIADISPLSGLIHLDALGLGVNNISDIAALAGLTHLKRLRLNHNRISDITAISGLTRLTELRLDRNNISDLSPLVANTGLGNGDEVDVQGNPLSHTSIKTHIPTLQSRGVTVEFDDTTHLNVGEPRTVRLIYFLPNDRPYRADVVQKMKDTIRTVQNFFAEQMETHGYGRQTFRVETDSQGDPIVHRVDGQHPDTYYLADAFTVEDEIYQAFNDNMNIYLVVVDNSIRQVCRPDGCWGGWGGRSRKQGGKALVATENSWQIVAHELGHTFGLMHDFRDGAYIMSYGPRSQDRLSQCHAEFLSVHPYFNLNTPIEEGERPTIELISPRTYPAGAKSISIQSQVSDSDGVHQVILHAAQPDNRWSVKGCHGFSGERSAITKFDYDGVIPSAHDPSYSRNTSLLNPLIHPIRVEAIDTDGNVGRTDFVLFSEALEPLTKISGDNLQGLPNTPLPVPFVVELRDLNDGSPRHEVWVTFTVITGGGTLSVERVKTDDAGRAESTLTLGPNFETNTVEVSAEGLTVTFNAVAVGPVDIPDVNLRAVIEANLDKGPGTPIAPAEIVTMPRLYAPHANISDLTGLEAATNLTELWLYSNSISDISPVAGLTNLRQLWLWDNNISDISPVAGLTNLTDLALSGNSISDISPVAGLTKLTNLSLDSNNIMDISVLTGLPNLIDLSLSENNISDISAMAGLIYLTRLHLEGNNISNVSVVSGLTGLTYLNLSRTNITDLSVVSGLMNLRQLHLWNNSVKDLSPLAGLTALTELYLGRNSAPDLSPLAGLINLESLYIDRNGISDLSPLAGLTQLTRLALNNNSVKDLSPLMGLTNLKWMRLASNNISDLSFLVENTGIGRGDEVDVSENPLNDGSINVHIPTLQSRGVEVRAEDLKPSTQEYLLLIPAGTNLIHVPLQVTAVDGVEQTLTSIADLYDTLGGAGVVNFLITYAPQTQGWLTYSGTSDRGTPADRPVTGDMGIIAGLVAPVSIDLTGTPLGTNGSSTISLSPGLNVVGLPLNNSDLARVSDLLELDGIRGNVPVIILTDGGDFQTVGRAGDPGDVLLRGGQGFILTAQQAATVRISGEAWSNASDSAAAPLVTLKGIVEDTTAVLALRGSIVDEGTGLNGRNFRVTVKNLSTGRAVATLTAADASEYQLAVVDIETGRAAAIGDVLEISAQSPHPFIGVHPLRYTVIAKDVRRSVIQLPELVAYEIPAETQLLANYPNPFNPETWIPYRLAEDAFVTLTIYDLSGQVVRTLDVGYRIASAYENQSKAVYWDGRNEFGESVASGMFFYHLSAGDYSAARKMLILK